MMHFCLFVCRNSNSYIYIIIFSYFLLDSKPINACIKESCMHLSFVFLINWTGQTKIPGRNPKELCSFQNFCFSFTYVLQQIQPLVSDGHYGDYSVQLQSLFRHIYLAKPSISSWKVSLLGTFSALPYSVLVPQ